MAWNNSGFPDTSSHPLLSPLQWPRKQEPGALFQINKLSFKGCRSHPGQAYDQPQTPITHRSLGLRPGQCALCSGPHVQMAQSSTFCFQGALWDPRDCLPGKGSSNGLPSVGQPGTTMLVLTWGLWGSVCLGG